MNSHDFDLTDTCTHCDTSREEIVQMQELQLNTTCDALYADLQTAIAEHSIRLAVVGGLKFTDYTLLSQVLDSVHSTINIIVSGGARGADTLAEKYALEHDIPMLIFLPDWDKYGKAAGPIRNKLIVNASDAMVAFLTSHSKGTRSSINLAHEAGIPIYIRRF